LNFFLFEEIKSCFGELFITIHAFSFEK